MLITSELDFMLFQSLFRETCTISKASLIPKRSGRPFGCKSLQVVVRASACILFISPVDPKTLSFIQRTDCLFGSQKEDECLLGST
jgi:hypothetical protein